MHQVMHHPRFGRKESSNPDTKKRVDQARLSQRIQTIYVDVLRPFTNVVAAVVMRQTTL